MCVCVCAHNVFTRGVFVAKLSRKAGITFEFDVSVTVHH